MNHIGGWKVNHLPKSVAKTKCTERPFLLIYEYWQQTSNIYRLDEAAADGDNPGEYMPAMWRGKCWRKLEKHSVTC
jgi:hypothetical protein